MRQVRFFFCLDCTDFAVFLCICLFKVPARGPWKSCLHLCPTSLGAFWFPWLCWGCFLPFSKAHILCHLLWASIWPLHGHHLSLKPVCIFSGPSSHPVQSLFFLKTGCHSGCSLTGAWLPRMGKYRECILTLNNFWKFFNLKYPEESCLHLSWSTAEVLSR